MNDERVRAPGDPPRRRGSHRVEGTPLFGHDLLRALAGSLIAVVGVAVGIAALLLLRGHPGGDGGGPAVNVPAAAIGAASPGATAGAGPATTPAGAATGPAQQSPVAAPSPAIPSAAASSAAASSAAASSAAASSAATLAPADRPALTVLNDSRISGLASRAAADFRAGGWPVAGVGNYPGRVPVTTAYYPPGGEAAARALAATFPAVAAVLPRFDGLPGTGLTVVVTREYAG